MVVWLSGCTTIEAWYFKSLHEHEISTQLRIGWWNPDDNCCIDKLNSGAPWDIRAGGIKVTRKY